jgi:RNA recognition motif-containing protein
MANKLYVGGLSFDTTEEELKAFFQQAGEVQTATIITDRFSGRSKGFGFVEMASYDETRKAISELNGKQLGDRSLRVEEARPAGQGGGRSGSGGGGSSYGRRRW